MLLGLGWRAEEGGDGVSVDNGGDFAHVVDVEVEERGLCGVGHVAAWMGFVDVGM